MFVLCVLVSISAWGGYRKVGLQALVGLCSFESCGFKHCGLCKTEVFHGLSLLQRSMVSYAGADVV